MQNCGAVYRQERDRMQEQIGKATIYHSEQAGAEAASASMEKKMLYDIVSRQKEADYHAAIINAKSWPVMYQLAEPRANVIEWLDVIPGGKALEIGAGCGTLTGALLKKGLRVTAQESDPDYCRLNAMRHDTSDGLTLYAQPFSVCEPLLPCDFDYVFSVGAQVDLPAGEFLKKIVKHLKPDGLLILATENKFGLKYWAGCAEDRTGIIFGGLERAPKTNGVPPCTKEGLQRLLADAGFVKPQFYYPYPDYRFALEVYSDERLPKKGELSYNIANYDHDRLILFDEQKVFDTIIAEGQFAQFSNSFLCFAKPAGAVSEAGDTDITGGVLYTRYASDRARAFAIRTDIRKIISGHNKKEEKLVVRKFPLYEAGAAHIRHIASAFEKLSAQYAESGLLFNDCQLREHAGVYAEFAFLRGESLLNRVEQAVAEEACDTVYGILTKMVQYIRSDKNSMPFRKTDAFTEVFGDVPEGALPEDLPCSAVSDIDLILPNIFVDGEGNWNVIDYEWTFFFPVPQNFIIYRTLFFLAHENPDCPMLAMEKLLNFAGITEGEAAAYEKMEAQFQRYVTGNVPPYREMVNLLERKFFHVAELKADYDRIAAQNELLKGKGFWKFARKLKRVIGRGGPRP